jgi:hypothetical protein
VSVVLNELAIDHLFNDPTGPVARRLQLLTDQTAVAATDNAQVIMKGNLPPGAISSQLRLGPDGLEGAVILDGGRISDYLRAKERKEENIFRAALRRIFG